MSTSKITLLEHLEQSAKAAAIVVIRDHVTREGVRMDMAFRAKKGIYDALFNASIDRLRDVVLRRKVHQRLIEQSGLQELTANYYIEHTLAALHNRQVKRASAAPKEALARMQAQTEYGGVLSDTSVSLSSGVDRLAVRYLSARKAASANVSKEECVTRFLPLGRYRQVPILAFDVKSELVDESSLRPEAGWEIHESWLDW